MTLAAHTTSTRRRRRVLAASLSLLTAVGGLAVTASSADAAVPPAPSDMTLVFSDGFDGAAGTGLNRGNWLYSTGQGYPGGAANWGTNEVETMTDSTANVFHDGHGHLAIKPIRDAVGNWTSGRVETQRTDFAAPVGGKVRIQASLQQPNVSGAAATGYWPAFWAMGAAARPVGATNWPSIGEWDIMESVNGRNSIFVTLHCGVAPGGPCNEFNGLASGERECEGCKTDFHTFAVEHDRSISPEQLRWYRDGSLIHTVSATQVDAATWSNATQHGMFIILNVAIGGDFPAAFDGRLPTAATMSGAPMLVDYVAVYQSSNGTTTPPTSGSRNAYGKIEAESYDASTPVTREAASEGGESIGEIHNGDWVQFNNVDFGTGGVQDFVGRVASGAGAGVSGLVEVRIDSRDSAPIGRFEVADSSGWQSWVSVPANIANVTGSHTVHLTFTSGQANTFVNVDWFTFRK